MAAKLRLRVSTRPDDEGGHELESTFAPGLPTIFFGDVF